MNDERISPERKGDYPVLDKGSRRPLRWLRQASAALVAIFVFWIVYGDKAVAAARAEMLPVEASHSDRISAAFISNLADATQKAIFHPKLICGPIQEREVCGHACGSNAAGIERATHNLNLYQLHWNVCRSADGYSSINRKYRRWRISDIDHREINDWNHLFSKFRVSQGDAANDDFGTMTGGKFSPREFKSAPSGPSQHDSRKEKQASEKRNVRVWLVKGGSPPIGNESYGRERAHKNGMLFLFGIGLGCLIFLVIIKCAR